MRATTRPLTVCLSVCHCLCDCGQPKQRYLRNQLWQWKICKLLSSCTNTLSRVDQRAVFTSSATLLIILYNVLLNFIWLFIACPQLVLCIPMVMQLHYRLAQISFMWQRSGIGLPVFLNWSSGTDDKRQLHIWEQRGHVSVSQGLRDYHCYCNICCLHFKVLFRLNLD